MAIGYANFATIQNGNQLINQGNQQVINSMANLGNQIGNTIETFAATQSAKTMLPMLQQQYQAGIQKVANGEQGGMADIIQAASLASQNPITAGYGKNMIDGLQVASHMANTQAYLQGTRLSSMAAHPEMYNPDGTLNTSRLGQAAPPKPFTPYQQEQSERNAATDRNAQLDEYSQLFDGQTLKDGTKVLGMGGYADKINEAIKEGKDVSKEDLQNFAQRYKYYKTKQSNYGKNAINNEDIDKAYDNIKDHLTVAQKDLEEKIKSAKEKGEDPSKIPNAKSWYNVIWPVATNDLVAQNAKLKETIGNFEGIHNIGKQGSVGGMPSTSGQWKAPQIPQGAIQHLLQNPSLAPQFDAKYGKGLSDQLLKQQQGSPQASTALPSASSVASADESETEPSQVAEENESASEEDQTSV
jgi:hypothetical protein